MFQPWIKKKAFKKTPQGSQLVVTSDGRPNVISLLSLSAILVGVGVFVIQHSLADSEAPVASPTPTMTAIMSPSPTMTPTPPAYYQH